MKRVHFIFLGLIGFSIFQESESLKRLNISLQITDCGDGEITRFITSVVPESIIYVEPVAFWAGGKVYFTELARNLVTNITVRTFVDDLKIFYVADSVPDVVKEMMMEVSDTPACQTFLNAEVCPVLYRSMQQSSNISFIQSIEPGHFATKFYETFLNVLENETEYEPQIVYFRIKLVLYTNIIACIQFKGNCEQQNIYEIESNSIRSENVKRLFSIPKISDPSKNGTLACPEPSRTINDSICLCPDGRSGPFCFFQCSFEQIDLPGCDKTKESYYTTSCEMTNVAYSEYCLHNKNISVLNDSITVAVSSLNLINISWNLINFPTEYFMEVTLQDNGGSLGYVIYDDFVTGTRTTINITTICSNCQQNIGIVDCRNITYEGEPCHNNCSNLKLTSFTDYTVLLRVGTGDPKGHFPGASWEVGSVKFTTPEIDPRPPAITKTTLSSDHSLIFIDWQLAERCPGYITHYEIAISCQSDRYVTQGFLDRFDCRLPNGSPTLNVTFPTKCRNEETKTTLRIGTNSSMSEESEPFQLNNGGWPLLLILAVAFGAFIIAVFIAVVVFIYYYKRHVEMYQRVYKTLLNLLQLGPKNRFESGSVRQRCAPPNQPIPDWPPRQDTDQNTTVFQSTISGTPEPLAPRRLENLKTGKSESVHQENDSSTPSYSLSAAYEAMLF